MKAKKVIEIQAENYIEEQLLMEAFPEAIWFTGVGNTRRRRTGSRPDGSGLRDRSE